MSFLDKLKSLLPSKKEEMEEPFPAPMAETQLPSDLEQFKQPPEGLPSPELTPSEPEPMAPMPLHETSPLEEQKIDFEPYPKTPTLPEPIKEEIEEKSFDKMDIIITKLDTIDSRLKLIEEIIKK